jgi:hypothetical protein
MSRSEVDPADAALLRLTQAIARGDASHAAQLLDAAPGLAVASIARGASRFGAPDYCLEPIGYYLYAGATALHAAATAYRTELAARLIALGADPRSRNRRGAEPLHAAAVGSPGSPAFDPRAQVATIACLIAAGADPNAVDISGVTPLHRAVRTRCAAAVQALLDHGADPLRRNGSGSSPMRLARLNTGRGGSGTAAAKAGQQDILRILRHHGAG